MQFDYDPLFKKTTKLFDKGTMNGLLLNSFHVPHQPLWHLSPKIGNQLDLIIESENIKKSKLQSSLFLQRTSNIQDGNWF